MHILHSNRPYNEISEKSFFFSRIETACKDPAIRCTPDMAVVEAARLMQNHDITGLVVVEHGTPLGVFTIRDVRKLIANSGGVLTNCTVRENMGHGLITIRQRDYVFDAVFKMAGHNIHHLGVVNDDGKLVGILTDIDLLKIPPRTPLYLHQEIEASHSIAQLRALGARMLDVVRCTIKTGIDTRSIVQLISLFNDAITLRLIALLDRTEGIRLPEGAAYLLLGSEGRGEQTLRSDQDNAIVYSDDLPPEKLREVERFAIRLVDALEEIGVPRCPGNIMASNPHWRHSLTEWKGLLNRWISLPTPEHILNFGMFQDIRSLHGDETLSHQLRDHIRSAVRNAHVFLPNMAGDIVRFPAPFTIFGRIRSESSGEHKGKVDLKKAGIFAMTAGARLLALELGIIGGNTWEKLDLLGKRGLLENDDLETIVEAFTFLTRLRLQWQLKALSANCQSTNHVDPLVMTKKEQHLFRQALYGVNTFLWIFRNHYQLDYVSI
jgi:CBS domain-containing protein